MWDLAGRPLPTRENWTQILDADKGGGGSRLTDAIAFVGGAYGIVLGLLLVFAVQHFVDTRHVSREEAITAAA